MHNALSAKMKKNELRSVLEWYPAANDVGEMYSSLTPVDSTLPAFESSFPIPPGITLLQNDVYLKTSKMDVLRFASNPLICIHLLDPNWNMPRLAVISTQQHERSH